MSNEPDTAQKLFDDLRLALLTNGGATPAFYEKRLAKLPDEEVDKLVELLHERSNQQTT